MAKDKMLFCAHCGERHTAKEKICKKCNNKLPVKSKIFINYLKNHIKDDLKGNVTERNR